MKFWIRFLIITAVLTGIGSATLIGIQKYVAERNKPKWRTSAVSRGDLVFEVNATGKVQPLRRVSIGAFVSGPVQELLVDFNDQVTVGQLLARIDPKLYEAAVRRDRALLSTRKAELQRVQATLDQAQNDEKRAQQLRSVDPNFISETELDTLRYTRIAREAELAVANTAIEQAEANLENSLANLEYTRIISPCDGIIIDRKIDSGQTIAASFQTPELFVVAPNLEEWVQIEASVDEADIGLIRTAREDRHSVSFTVDAYPDQIFRDGVIEQVRLSSGESQNVITYPVIVRTSNEGMKLLPGMTANLSFQIESKQDIVMIPNAALRFYPEKQYVHPDDRPILEGAAFLRDTAKDLVGKQSADEKLEQSRNLRNRHVWVQRGEWLQAIEIVTGISDNRYTEMLSGKLDISDRLVTGKQVSY